MEKNEIKRYIRTTNGQIIDTQKRTSMIFDYKQYFVLNENELVERYSEEYGANGCWCCEYKYRKVGIVFKQSDNLEELCDETILKDTKSRYCCVLPKDKEIKFDKVNMGNAYGREFYGAIWFLDDHGKPILKPVAQINNEGKLELL